MDMTLRKFPGISTTTVGEANPAGILSRVSDFLMPPAVIGGEQARGKARLLIYIHLLALLGGVSLATTDLIFHREMLVVSGSFILGVAAMLAVFKRVGDIILSGNLLVALVAVVLVFGIVDSGGLYSDSLLWLMLAPVIAFLFTSRYWGVVWSLALFAILVILYFLEIYSAESYRYASLDFGPRYYLVSYLGLFSGVLGVILIFVRNNDLTLVKLLRTTSELRAQQAQTAAQNARLIKQEAELRRSNRDLELFAYVASHDLKEPLRMVNAYSQLIERRAADKLPDKEREYLGFVRDGAERMTTMLDDLLSYSRLGRERTADQAVDLNRTLLVVRHNLTKLVAEKRGTLDVGPMPTLVGKPTHFVQLFQNLIANAVKFRRPDHDPIVAVEAVPRPDGGVVIRVTDNGIGMRAEDTEEIFGVFQRLNGRGEFEGSGIGLATVKRILDELGAGVSVSSQPGVGSTFELAFPPTRVVA